MEETGLYKCNPLKSSFPQTVAVPEVFFRLQMICGCTMTLFAYTAPYFLHFYAAMTPVPYSLSKYKIENGIDLLFCSCENAVFGNVC